MAKNRDGGMKARRLTADIITYIFLAVMCVVWLLPFFWVIMQSFRDGTGQSLGLHASDRFLSHYLKPSSSL